MNDLSVMVALVAGSGLGGLIVWLLLRSRLETADARAKSDGEAARATLQTRLEGAERQVQDLRQQVQELSQQKETLQHRSALLQSRVAELEARLELDQKAWQEKLALVQEAKESLTHTFKALSAEALNSNNESFIQLAKSTLETVQESAKGDLAARQQAINELVSPLKESLIKVDQKIQELEQARAAAYGSLNNQLSTLANAQAALHTETSKLVQALRAPQVRGRWGEIQLKRVVELVGMVEYCDFVQQDTVATDDGKLRPDMVVSLPNSRQVVVDAKAPLMAYLEALEAPNEEIRATKLKEHARQVKTHVAKLSEKRYWSQFESAPEFVVLFLPGEVFFSAALEHDPSLIEYGVGQNVVLATPTILIALLRAVASGWQEEQITKNAQAIRHLGKELYERTSIFAHHLGKLGRQLDQAVGSYNEAVSSFETRLLVSARKFKELGATGDKEIEAMPELDRHPRALRAVAQVVAGDSGTDRDGLDDRGESVPGAVRP